MILVKKMSGGETKLTQAAAKGGTEGQKHSYVLKKLKKFGGTESEKELPVTGMWSFPPTLQEGENFKLSDLDLRFIDKVNYDELKNKKTTDLTLLVLDFLLPKLYSDYYLIEGVSDFWKYQVDDKVSLNKVTASGNGNTGGSGSTTTPLGDFQMVAGVSISVQYH